MASNPRAATTAWASVAALTFSLVLAALLRLPALDLRPMHTDEAVHAYKLETLRATGTYIYDPKEYHGPTLYYLTLPILWVCGVTDSSELRPWMLRLVPALAGIALIPLLGLVRDGLGRIGIAAAALLTACSPALVFYSRYYIQEELLVVFTFGLIGCAWRFLQTRRLPWLVAAGVCMGLMHATKETAIIAWAAMIGGLIACWIWSKAAAATVPASVGEAKARSTVTRAPPSRPRLPASAIAIFLLSAIVVSIACYSVGFQHWRGPLDSLVSYLTYLHRAGGGIHDQPWDYYFRILLYTHMPGRPVWSDAITVLLALIGGVFAMFDGRPFPRFLLVHALLMTAAYTVIHYKTPWCMLGFLHAYILLAGYAVERLLAQGKMLKIAAIGSLIGGAAWDVSQAREQTYRYYARPINPFVYGHTVSNVVDIPKRCEEIASLTPIPQEMLIRIIMEDPWPLPWYLRDFRQVGYWEDPPDDCDAPIVITSTTLEARVRVKLKQEYFAEICGVRPDYFAVVLIRHDLWDAYLAQRTVGAQPGAAP